MTDDDREALAKQFRALRSMRTGKDRKQEVVAKKAGIATNTLRSIEQNTRKSDIENLELLARAYGTTLAKMLQVVVTDGVENAQS